MIKNLKDLIIVALVIGVLSLLGLIIVGDYYVALQENRPVDETYENGTYRINRHYCRLHRRKIICSNITLY